MDERPLSWPLIAAEVECLERLDLPLFRARPVDRQLRVGLHGECIPLGSESGWEQTMARVRGLSRNGCDRELARIRQAVS